MEKRSTRRRADGQLVNSLRPGFGVAVVLKDGAAPMRCYVGQVQAVDQHGVRLTLLDWFIGRPTGWDFFISWENIASALVATPEHDMEQFGDAAAVFQIRCEYMDKGEEAAKEAIAKYRETKRESQGKSSIKR